MATYVIGDIHGCFDELQQLLIKIAFNVSSDTLWFTGDLVNGGTKSLETLLFIKNLGSKAICVLGNHDLTLLRAIINNTPANHLKNQALQQILNHQQCHELTAWLQQLPLIHYDIQKNILLVHAGLAPQWDLNQALTLAKELATIIKGPQAATFFANMFGDEPALWQDNLTGWERYRCITNYLTRLRFCRNDGFMNLVAKGPVHDAPANMLPWYAVPSRLTRNIKIIFGHWAALQGQVSEHNVIAVDTGCVWGHHLTALRLEDNYKFTVPRLKS